MYKSESILENRTDEFLRYFQIQADDLIPARLPDLMIVNKKCGGDRTSCLADFTVLAD